MIIHWANNFDQRGNALGYTTHQKMLRAAIERAGVEVTDDPKKSNISVSIITPPEYKPVEGNYNILYTMYECTTLPPTWPEHINKADMVVVPCEHNKKLFRNYTKLPIEVCLEGCETDIYSYKERKMTDPFIFLWVGASNPRKGYEHVSCAWERFKTKYPELNGKVLLYMKTTQQGVSKERLTFEGGELVMKEQPRDRILDWSKEIGVIIDTRRLPFTKDDDNPDGWPTLADLYHKANAFLLPSMGEGFGLTLAEAMSTGLPCIYTPWSGPQDFVSYREGFPLKWHFVKINTVSVMPDGSRRPAHSSNAASAEIDDIVKQMHKIYTNYEWALEKGKRAAERIRKEITWDISAKRFIDIVKQYAPKKEAVS